jgi:hypothetical protein
VALQIALSGLIFTLGFAHSRQVKPKILLFSIARSARLRRELSRTMADWDCWNLQRKKPRRLHLFSSADSCPLKVVNNLVVHGRSSHVTQGFSPGLLILFQNKHCYDFLT